uniref:Uncharacterized protein n=1 Tax=Anopheles coluzzii TaxID=1518534 RepID=A0A8W7PKS2_ANOCL
MRKVPSLRFSLLSGWSTTACFGASTVAFAAAVVSSTGATVLPSLTSSEAAGTPSPIRLTQVGGHLQLAPHRLSCLWQPQRREPQLPVQEQLALPPPVAALPTVLALLWIVLERISRRLQIDQLEACLDEARVRLDQLLQQLLERVARLGQLRQPLAERRHLAVGVDRVQLRLQVDDLRVAVVQIELALLDVLPEALVFGAVLGQLGALALHLLDLLHLLGALGAQHAQRHRRLDRVADQLELLLDPAGRLRAAHRRPVARARRRLAALLPLERGLQPLIHLDGFIHLALHDALLHRVDSSFCSWYCCLRSFAFSCVISFSRLARHCRKLSLSVRSVFSSLTRVAFICWISELRPAIRSASFSCSFSSFACRALFCRISASSASSCCTLRRRSSASFERFSLAFVFSSSAFSSASWPSRLRICPSYSCSCSVSSRSRLLVYDWTAALLPWHFRCSSSFSAISRFSCVSSLCMRICCCVWNSDLRSNSSVRSGSSTPAPAVDGRIIRDSGGPYAALRLPSEYTSSWWATILARLGLPPQQLLNVLEQLFRQHRALLVHLQLVHRGLQLLLQAAVRLLQLLVAGGRVAGRPCLAAARRAEQLRLGQTAHQRRVDRLRHAKRAILVGGGWTTLPPTLEHHHLDPQVLHDRLQLLDAGLLRVLVDDRLVLDLAHAVRVPQRAVRFRQVVVGGRHAGYHERVGIAAQRVLQQPGQLRAAVRYVHLTGRPRTAAQRRDHVAERQQTLRSPVVSVFFERSDPARSTRWNLERVTTAGSSRAVWCSVSVKIAWLRLDTLFIAVARTTRPSEPRARQSNADCTPPAATSVSPCSMMSPPTASRMSTGCRSVPAGFSASRSNTWSW